jgi:hypothetical protein
MALREAESGFILHENGDHALRIWVIFQLGTYNTYVLAIGLNLYYCLARNALILSGFSLTHNL